MQNPPQLESEVVMSFPALPSVGNLVWVPTRYSPFTRLSAFSLRAFSPVPTSVFWIQLLNSGAILNPRC